MPSIEEIDRCLPQTQCTKCSYPGCKEYAQAIAQGDADINQCPPGGDVTVASLAELLQRDLKPLDISFGEHLPKKVAQIVERDCIGCMLCIKACPVDAILGTNKLMHSVIEAECTGCELCIAPCPMDCIEMVEPTTLSIDGPWADYSLESANKSRIRREHRLTRIAQNSKSKRSKTIDRKKIIQDSINRAMAKRNEC